MTTLMTQNPAMRGEKIYEYEFDIGRSNRLRREF
jgi:hypothetical protein